MSVKAVIVDVAVAAGFAVVLAVVAWGLMWTRRRREPGRMSPDWRPGDER